MNIYLHDIPLEEAKDRFHQAISSAGLEGILGLEEIPLDETAIGRVLGRPIWAKISSPHYHAVAMDGYAVQSADTAGALPNTPRHLAIPSQAVYVDTGDPLPAGMDALIPIENVEPVDQDNRPSTDIRQPAGILIRNSVTPWSHIRPMGEDIVATQLVLPAGHRLRPVDLGAVAASGHTTVMVARKPRVAILPTGSELIPVGESAVAGKIIEYNSIVLAAQVNSWGGLATRFSIVPDNFEEISRQVDRAAAAHDLILLNAGSSAGSEDYSAKVITALGKLLVHGVAVRPGHPVILGMIAHSHGSASKIRQVPIIGVPGYPVSAALTGEIFVEPLINDWLGVKTQRRMTVNATLTRKLTSPAGDDDFVRVAVGRVGQRVLAAPLSRGAGVITSLVRADGLAILPRGSQGLPAGAEVQVHLYRSMDEIENTILAIGSHDLTLDLLAQYLAGRDRRLASANVGSLGGLVALRRGEAHLAGSHLLDVETGEYNLSAVRQYLPGISVKLISLVGRSQGLLVAKGNPKRILSLSDLSRKDVSFINRQRGAGTRVLLDYQLGLLGINVEEIQGYHQEEYTHLAVAAAVSSRRADCGLGIAAAAHALDLDFVPLFEERFDLVIPNEYTQGELLVPMFEIIADPGFQKTIASLPGYDVSRMGEIVAEFRASTPQDI